MEEFRLKHAGRNVPLPSPNADAWKEEMKEEEEEEDRRVTWVKVEDETQFPSGIKAAKVRLPVRAASSGKKRN